MTFPQMILHYLVTILSKTRGVGGALRGALNTLLLHSRCMSYPLPTPHFLLCPPPRQLSEAPLFSRNGNREPLLLHHREMGQGGPH